MLQHSLYEIESMKHQPGLVEARLRLDPLHSIFQGHFPGTPVLPGVCMMQIVKETLEEATGTSFRLREAAYAKFLRMINPLETEVLEIRVEYLEREDRNVETRSTLFTGDCIFLKYQALFERGQQSEASR